MNFNKILQSLFGNKSTRDMKLIQPIVEKVKAEYPKMNALSNDELRAKTKELQKYVQEYAKEEKAKIAELKAKIEDTPIDEREGIFNQIDKLEQEALDKYEVALNEVLPQVFAIVKDTARRFAENEETVVTATDFDRELASNPANDFVTIDGDKAIYHNHWTAGGNDMKWEMIHYDVQLFGGVVLHQGKIAEMATGEGKTLVGTTPRCEFIASCMHFLNNTHYTKFIFFCIRDCTFCFLGFVLSNVVFKPYRTHSHFLIVKCCGSYTKISCVICKRIKYLTVCNTPCHHNIRCSMCLREHVLDSLTRPYIPVWYTVVNHILLPLRPFFAFAGCDLTLSDHFHYFK